MRSFYVYDYSLLHITFGTSTRLPLSVTKHMQNLWESIWAELLSGLQKEAFWITGGGSWLLIPYVLFHIYSILYVYKDLITTYQETAITKTLLQVLYIHKIFGHKVWCTDGSTTFVCYYVGYSESKYCLRISLTHPQDCHFAHVQWLPLSIEKPQTPFCEICVMFMFVPVR